MAVKKVPNIKVEATGDQEVNLKNYNDRKLVIYFYPKDSTPGCTQEGQDFRDLYRKFRRARVTIFGVSRDSVRSHENFKAKHDFPFELLSDPDEKLCRAFDVIKEKNMYGKKHLGIERSTFLFDDKGNLVQEWRKVKVKGHAQEVLDAARAIK